MINGDKPAFPIPESEGHYFPHGLTKLEYFSGMAMQAVIGTMIGPVSHDEGGCTFSRIAEVSVGLSKALLKELEKQ